MATTIGDVIDYVLGTLSRADVGDDRTLVKSDIVDLLTVDIPAEVGGYMLEGTVELSVGYTGSVSESGVYDVPAAMRACKGVLCMIDDVSLSTPALVSPWNQDYTYTDVDDFYASGQYGPANATSNQYGQPGRVLIYKNQIHLRPIPKQAATPEWFGKVVLYGSVLQDLSAATEATVIADERIVPCVRAGASLLNAVRMRRPDVATMWSDIFSVRKNELRALMSAYPSSPQPPGSDF